MILPKEYFINNDTPGLAYDLLGKSLVRERGGVVTKHIISEVEAYHGFEDKASHARFGKTSRNQVIYQSGGIWYLYLCYGIHWMLNVVSGVENFPAAILIRGIDQTFGPGKVTAQLKLDKSFNARPITPSSKLWIEDQGITPQKIESSKRIGINYAEDYIDKLWRFHINKL